MRKESEVTPKTQESTATCIQTSFLCMAFFLEDPITHRSCAKQLVARAVAQKKAWESGHGLRYCRLLYSVPSTSANEGSRHFANPHASNPHAAGKPRHRYCGAVWSGLPRADVA